MSNIFIWAISFFLLCSFLLQCVSWAVVSTSGLRRDVWTFPLATPRTHCLWKLSSPKLAKSPFRSSFPSGWGPSNDTCSQVSQVYSACHLSWVSRQGLLCWCKVMPAQRGRGAERLSKVVGGVSLHTPKEPTWLEFVGRVLERCYLWFLEYRK